MKRYLTTCSTRFSFRWSQRFGIDEDISRLRPRPPREQEPPVRADHAAGLSERLSAWGCTRQDPAGWADDGPKPRILGLTASYLHGRRWKTNRILFIELPKRALLHRTQGMMMSVQEFRLLGQEAALGGRS